MMFNPPFGYSPFSQRYYQTQEWKRKQLVKKKEQEEKEKLEKQKAMQKQKEEEQQKKKQEYFEIFGLHLYFDDILIICLLFFLYQEGVQDQSLFLCLILLLLT